MGASRHREQAFSSRRWIRRRESRSLAPPRKSRQRELARRIPILEPFSILFLGIYPGRFRGQWDFRRALPPDLIQRDESRRSSKLLKLLLFLFHQAHSPPVH